MTDDLIRLMRAQLDTPLYEEAADALEVKDKRIAELEAALTKVGYDFTLSRDELAIIAREELRT
mgnify:CR=1 FL=1